MAATATTPLELIAAERARQVSAEGWTSEHDDAHAGGELALAAASYAIPPRRRWNAATQDQPTVWPWEGFWWKPTPRDRIRELVKAGALIVAEIERLQREAEALDA